MAKAVLNLSGLNPGARILRIRQIVLKTTGSSVYVTPAPTLEAITTAVNLLESKEIDVKNRLAGAVTVRDLQNNAVLALMNSFLEYVQVASGGDQVKIEGISLNIKAPASPSQPMGKVVLASGTVGSFAGETNLTWKSMPKAKFYQVQMSADGQTNWANQGDSVTKSKVTLTGLVSETGSYFRIAAGNGLGLGEWCDPFKVMAK